MGNIINHSSLHCVCLSDREHRRRQFDVRNDSGRNLRISDSIEDKANDRKVLSSNSKGNSDEQVQLLCPLVLDD